MRQLPSPVWLVAEGVPALRDVLTGAVALSVAIAVLVTCAPAADPHADFPLEGRHAMLLCETCHGLDGFGPLPSACAECHEADRPPNHYAGDCGDCHSALAWDQPVGTGTTHAGDHDFLPLVNSHDLPCESCHQGDGYGGLDATCESCHDRPSAYHYGGEDCAPCHAPTVWTDGKEHTFVVPHNGVDACVDCHPDPATPATAVCTTCHPVADMEGVHSAVYGFASDDPSCIGCHPDGAR